MIIRRNQELIEPYLHDASNFEGIATVVYLPETVQELKDAVKECYDNNTPITISAARTGLTGGCIPLEGASISTERLNKIIRIDKSKKTATVMPGVIISDLEDELNSIGLFYPPNPTEKNSFIGGNVGTNASGARTFKYGATRKFINRLEILFPDGDELSIRRGQFIAKDNKLEILTLRGKKISVVLPEFSMPNVKHAAGYYIKPNMDAIDLFIGSEGTLGIFTEIELKLLEQPDKLLGGIIFFDDEENLLDFVNEIRNSSILKNSKDYRQVSEISARLIEFYDYYSLQLLRKTYTQIPQSAKAAIWFEQEYAENYEDIILDNWYNKIMKYSNLHDSTWIALNHKEHENLRNFRHELPLQVNEILSRKGPFKFGTDTAVPIEHFKEYYYFLKKEMLASGLDNLTWGHIGNSHLHANLLPSSAEDKVKAEKFYFKCIKKAIDMGGSVSAEHGIGKNKKKYLKQMYGKQILDKMKSIKLLFDPNNLLCRDNLFD